MSLMTNSSKISTVVIKVFLPNFCMFKIQTMHVATYFNFHLNMLQQLELKYHKVSTFHHVGQCFSNQLMFSENVEIGVTVEWLTYFNLPVPL